jgi:hypothetical protein
MGVRIPVPGARTRLAVVGAVVAALLSSGAVFGFGNGVAQGAVPGHGVGVVSDLTWYMSRPDMDRSIAMMKTAGVQWVRASMNWATLEPTTKGVLDSWWMPELDYAVQQARAAGLQVLMPISDGVPYWASADPAKYTDAGGQHWNKLWKPTNFSDYADFSRTIVTRYKAFGVHSYEVWNEPNYARFWPSGPNPADYTAMLRAAYPAIKQADPSATVLMGGLSGNDYDFLQGIYAAGGGAYFDAAAVHPYTDSNDPTACWYQAGTTRYAKFAFCGIEEVRKTMLANGDSRSLWLTEMGWSTSAVTNGVSEATQADFLTKAFTKVESYPYVANAFWYSFRNNWWTNNDPTDLEANYGLARTDFSLKPAYSALQAYATAGVPVVTTTVAPAPTTTVAPTTTTTVTVPDTRPPTLSNIRSSGIKRTGATLSWATDEAADSVVDYWPAGSSSTSTVRDSRLLSSHQVVLTTLQRATTYYYRVSSADRAGNRSVSATYAFTTSL